VPLLERAEAVEEAGATEGRIGAKTRIHEYTNTQYTIHKDANARLSSNVQMQVPDPTFAESRGAQHTLPPAGSDDAAHVVAGQSRDARA
jgi:hypothetical protein